MLIAIGFTLLLRVADIINFAHGAIVVGGMFLGVFFVNRMNLPFALAVPLIVLVGLVAAWLMYELLIRRARDSGHREQIVVTVLLASILELIYALVFGTEFTTLKLSTQVWQVFGVDIQREAVIAFVVAMVTCTIFAMIFRFTLLGKSIEIAGKYPDGARAIGLSVSHLYRIVFLTGTGMALLAGAFLAATTSVTPYLGFQYVIVALLITVAGRENFVGVAAASLLYGVGYGVLSAIMPSPERATVALYLVFILVIALEPLSRRVIRRIATSHNFRTASIGAPS